MSVFVSCSARIGIQSKCLEHSPLPALAWPGPGTVLSPHLSTTTTIITIITTTTIVTTITTTINTIIIIIILIILIIINNMKYHNHRSTGEAGEELLDHGRQLCDERPRRREKSSVHQL